MKALYAAAVIAVFTGPLAHAVVAQNTRPPANPDASTTAVAAPKANNPGAPASGANSFTEGQARSRIEAAGYSNVSGLAKDNDGIWRGKASKDGRAVEVALDYQGNIVAK